MSRSLSRCKIKVPISTIRYFSTTSSCRLPQPTKGKGLPSKVPKRGGTLVLKKKEKTKVTNPALPGERKAFKNRIVLSNTNANTRIPGLQDLSTTTMKSDDSLGKVLAIPGPVVDALRALGAFKRNQAWNNYHKPATLMTKEAFELAGIISDIQGRSMTRVISGIRKTGKSTLLLQTMSMALLNKWIVISIPQCEPYTSHSVLFVLTILARELVDAKSNYQPIRNSNPPSYSQNEATLTLLQSILEANRPVLSTLIMSKSYPDISLKPTPKTTLVDLINFAQQSPDSAWKVHQALWSELTLPNSSGSQKIGTRPPILYCADNISHLLTPSHYQVLDKNGNLAPIHALDLALPRHFVDHLVGSKTLPNGGLVLGATSHGDFVACPPLDVAVSMAEARNSSPGKETVLADFWNPLQRIDQRVMDMLLNVNTTTLKGVTKAEAKSIIEYWAYNGVVRERIAESWVGEKWALSGGGVLGELEKAVVRMRF